MKPTFHSSAEFADPAAVPSRPRQEAAFSLVEVTLALGISAFALMGVLGVMPTAISTARQSFDQNRAAAIANTLFASFRSQSFSNVCYLDAQFDNTGAAATSASVGLNLNAMSASSTLPAFCASFLDPNVASTNDGDTYGQQRRLCFAELGTAQRQAAANYSVTLHFNNAPAGMSITPASGSAQVQANQIEMIISPLAQPANKYTFVSTVANRF